MGGTAGNQLVSLAGNENRDILLVFENQGTDPIS